MYQALYRKYRPVDFDSVVGQEPIIRTLKNSIAYNNFSHAYMFFGSRGIGKTTVSKIFARNVNCLNSKDGLACGKCKNCEYSFSKDCIDIIEIDAASNNGVDDIRNLKNRISLVPSELKYKVYIIDEVHMLSIEAFNALLKTLEEPPEHAIFILATTDPQKVPETIISRCQCFSFKKISPSVIKQRLITICEKESIDIDDVVLDHIAVFADGGLRDALGMLDKLTSYTDKKIVLDDFIEINGIVSNDDINSFLKNIYNNDVSSVLNSIQSFDENGKNLIQILIQLLNYSRNLIVDYYISDNLGDLSIDFLQKFTNELNEKMFDIKKSDNSKISFELFVLKFMTNSKVIVSSNTLINENNDLNTTSTSVCLDKVVDNMSTDLDDNLDNDINTSSENNNLSTKIVSDNNYVSDVDLSAIIPKIINIDEIMKIRINNTFALANKEMLRLEQEKFNLLKDYTFDQEIGYIVCSLLDSNLRVVSSDNIILSYKLDSVVRENLNIIDKIIDVYNKITNSNKKIAIVSDKQWDVLKNEYINNLKNKVKYDVLDEPEEIFEEIKNNDIITSSAIDLFGDIVEVE